MKKVSGGHTQQGNAHRACVQVGRNELRLDKLWLLVTLQLLVSFVGLRLEAGERLSLAALISFWQLVLSLGGPLLETKLLWRSMFVDDKEPLHL